MNDTDQFSDLEIFAMTLIGEAESLGHQGMAETASVILNRTKANIHWLGGNNARNVCLRPKQFSCWNPGDNSDRERIINIAKSNPTYGPYVDAIGIATGALAGAQGDLVNGAVSYFDSNVCATPRWAVGKQPCYIDGSRFYYDLAAVS